jgi:DNA polymerase (family 10)
MTNSDIADIFSLTAKLLELHSANPFVVKAYQKLAYEIERLPYDLSTKLAEFKSFELPFSQSSIEKIKEVVYSGSFSVLNELLTKTPPSVIEMFNIQGLGPKKIQTIWLQLGIDNLADLLHACHENRLSDIKGFGKKTQESIQKSIEFYYLSKGKLHLHNAFAWRDTFLNKASFPLYETGKLLTWDNYVEILEFVTTASPEEVYAFFVDLNFLLIEKNEYLSIFKNAENVTVKVYFAELNRLQETIFLHTLEYDSKLKFGTNIAPQHRYHHDAELYYSRYSKFIENQDIKGLVHCHSTYSDGKNTLEQMVKACLDVGYEYMVITDHSQSAFYANGLTPSRLEVQWNEIDQLNSKFRNFKIFKGIESDILRDGSLDYSVDILNQFDCVIASVHSHLKMDKQEATQRIIKAIENPYTRILGHLTGRLLLIREGYPVDYQKVFDACARNLVAVEINANPYRLDLDWTLLRQAVDSGVEIFINPDAHSLEGIKDVLWGVMLANKAFLTAAEVVNTKCLTEFEAWIKQKKSART